jgi:hypothetical protein
MSELSRESTCPPQPYQACVALGCRSGWGRGAVVTSIRSVGISSKHRCRATLVLRTIIIIIIIANDGGVGSRISTRIRISTVYFGGRLEEVGVQSRGLVTVTTTSTIRRFIDTNTLPIRSKR